MLEYSAVLYDQGNLEQIYGPFPQKIADDSINEDNVLFFLSFGFKIKDKSVQDPRIVKRQGQVSAIMLMIYPQQFDSLLILRKQSITEKLLLLLEKTIDISEITGNVLSNLELELKEAITM